jgi:membrane associated rhomboid family serine protease
MKTVNKRSPFSYISGYSKNAVLHIIIASSVAFVLYHGIRVIMLMAGITAHDFNTFTVPQVALYTLPTFKTHFWTLLTYGWLHNGFWELLTNMLWLYCFGNLVQVLIGYKQVIPIFIYSTVGGGVFYLLSQFIPRSAFVAPYYLIGSQAGLTGMTAAAVALAPDYRFFLGDRFRIPIMAVAGIFLFLMLLNTHFIAPQLFLLAGGALSGLGYMLLLRKGYRPGAWMYGMFTKLENITSPDETVLNERRNRKREQAQKRLEARQQITQLRIDEILDKINQKGYNSLTSEEKDILNKASKEN